VVIISELIATSLPIERLILLRAGERSSLGASLEQGAVPVCFPVLPNLFHITVQTSAPPSVPRSQASRPKDHRWVECLYG